MKTTSKVLLLCILLIAFYSTNAQVTTSQRPALFSNVSATIPTAVTELNKAFLSAKGSLVRLNLSSSFSISGTVISSIQRFNNLSTVLIKLPLLDNSLLSISKRINDDRTITYVGHIINEKSADGYELKQDRNGNYFFNKIKTEDLIQDF